MSQMHHPLYAGLIDRGQSIEPHPFPVNPPTGGELATRTCEAHL